MLGQATKTCPSLMCWGKLPKLYSFSSASVGQQSGRLEKKSSIWRRKLQGSCKTCSHSPNLLNWFPIATWGKPPKVSNSFFLEPNWAANACLKQILRILIDIWNLTSHIGMGQQETQLPDNTLFYFDTKVGFKHLGATHCLLILPHTSHLLGQASEAHECKGNPPASCASCAGARHQSIRVGMRATAWLIHVIKNMPFTSISWQLIFSTCLKA